MHVLDVITLIFGAAVLVAIFARSLLVVAIMLALGVLVAISWPR